MELKFPTTKASLIILIAIILGASAFTIFIAPGLFPELPHSNFYPVLTNLMGLFAILSALLFLYWAYGVSKKMKIKHIHVSKKTQANNSQGKYIFCSECELIEGKANICKGCLKSREGKI